ncbi:Cilia- and flagella-associated protein 161 [Hondaea fermentalgiana]|uniref:Cilia-and flagella-associated protein 161 n=1 Tax=Hondaea fermentalgiana TaxID=2315210 RepID=A0A2R5G652_9STRA|nr:Cilia- and flagella-associated protein 161 [Hondaea fermentalgiana]|eukprot:GBG26537.1 Cilia- and flagella-associated protein 161 [Hondaea fermentalgiana]
MALQTGTTQYGQQTLVGNWSEDVQEEEIKFAEYLARKKANKLLLSERHTVFQHALQGCPLTFKHQDEALCFGDSVMLENSETGGYLAVHPAGDDWMVSTWPTSEIRPMARTVFRIVPPHDQEIPTDTPLCYGDVFALICDPVLTANADGVVLSNAWVTCEPKSYQRVSKLASESDVRVSKTHSKQAEWKIESSLPGDAGWRVNVSRAPVKVGDAFFIKHRMSNQALSSSTRFGFSGKLSNVEEFETFAKPVTKASPAHTWQFCVACDPEMARDERGLIALSPSIATEALRVALESCMDDFLATLERLESHETLENKDIEDAVLTFAPGLAKVYVQCFLRNQPSSLSMDSICSALTDNGDAEEKNHYE